jgi:xanthine dehydrogenase YagS FAD-binding subunit
MNNFSWVEPKTIDDAATAVKNGGAPMSGGIELLCLLKEQLIEPPTVVNLKSIPGMRSIEASGGGAKIGALVTATELVESAMIRMDFAGVHQAANSMASPQIRNVGTVGGNLGQRPRCWYFRDPEVNCLKKGGAACFAVAGNNEYHAILGGGPCHIVHPSDLGSAFMAYGATIVTNERQIPIEQFFVLPREDVNVENVLRNGELITGVDLPGDWKGSRAAFYKAKERESFDWALSTATVLLKMSGSTISDARVVLGGVAPIPWRSKEAEDALKGKTPQAAAEAAGQAAVSRAIPMTDNRYKIPLTANVVRIAVLQAAGLPTE